MNWNSGRAWLAYSCAALLVSACGAKKDEARQQGPPPAIPVAVYKVKQEPVVSTDTYPGTVVPLNEVEIRAEVGGFLTELLVRDGQRVTKGQKLYAIDRTRYLAAYNQAQAQLQQAQTNYNRVARDDERYQRLAEQDAIAKQQVDVSKAELANAASQIAAARAALSSVALDLRHSTLVAPLTGTLGISQVKQGGLVVQGTTLLNTLSSESPIGVDFTVSEQEIPRFVRLQGDQNAVRDSLFTLLLAGDQAYQRPGKIVTIDRALDPQTGTLKVRLQFPNPDRVLKAGMNCSLQVLNQDTGEKIVIPNKAITEQMGEFFVYVVGDSSKVKQRKVVTGTRIKDLIVVRSGLKVNETIVSDGVQNLQEGARVQIGDPNKPAAGQGPPTAAK
ncbi:MAG: efflux RND transporter periplasmic adaptor subunit [Hymenobacter sp.]|nr:efflux RND transporter periplasmic adaptor subunit [Hymenobacter sp.]